VNSTAQDNFNVWGASGLQLDSVAAPHDTLVESVHPSTTFHHYLGSPPTILPEVCTAQDFITSGVLLDLTPTTASHNIPVNCPKLMSQICLPPRAPGPDLENNAALHGLWP